MRKRRAWKGRRLRAGFYVATYYLTSWSQASWMVRQMYESVVASFGDGDDQWQGIDLTDKGARVLISEHKHGVRLRVCVPVLLPQAYWFSPFCDDDIQTFDKDGQCAQGEAASWGAEFVRPRWAA